MAVLLALGDRYGFHRDELYFLIDGRHPAFGYVDQPPITPLLARVQQAMFGDSPLAVRVWPALVAGTVVVLSALLCSDLGGGRRAQAVLAVGVATSPGVLLAGHLLSTEVTDLLVWQVVLLLAVRALRDDRPRLWLAIGVCVGIGLQNKDLIGFLALALIAGLIASGRREILTSRYLWLGAALALLIAAPAIVWQATRGMPQWQVAQAQRHGTGPVKYVAQQLVVLNPALLPAMAGGVRVLWRARRYRPLVWAFASSPYAAEDDTRATIGWPQLATQIDRTAAEVGAAHPVVLTQSYGEAGALERYGDRGITVVSGHNALWYYRRPASGTSTILAVGYPPTQLHAWFARCRQVAAVRTPHGIDNHENGAPITVCTQPRQDWSHLWPKLRHNN